MRAWSDSRASRRGAYCIQPGRGVLLHLYTRIELGAALGLVHFALINCDYAGLHAPGPPALLALE